jgi:hypothetical protein
VREVLDSGQDVLQLIDRKEDTQKMKDVVHDLESPNRFSDDVKPSAVTMHGHMVEVEVTRVKMKASSLPRTQSAESSSVSFSTEISPMVDKKLAVAVQVSLNDSTSKHGKNETKQDVVDISMSSIFNDSKVKTSSIPISMEPIPSTLSMNAQLNSRHKKEKRQRGCPCCDPDSLENLMDKMLFLEHSPN